MLIGKASGTNPISRYGGLQHHGAGVLLTGSEPASPLYFKKYKPAVMTPQQLDHQAVWRRTAMMSKDMLYSESLQASDSQTESNAEVEASFLSGPFCTGRNC